jgi:hypothetical protein
MRSTIGRKTADDALILALACGASIETAAQKVGVGPRTVHRRLKDPEFMRRLDEVRGEMLKRTTDMLTAAALEAVRTLVSLQSAATAAAVRLGAARAILEIGVKYRETNDLAQRILTLEQQVAENATAARHGAWS